MSSVFNPTETNHREFNAVNNVTICSGGTYTAHSNSDHRPWIRIDLQSIYDVQRVVIFNRQDRFGRFVNKDEIKGENYKKKTHITYPFPRYNLFK